MFDNANPTAFHWNWEIVFLKNLIASTVEVISTHRVNKSMSRSGKTSEV